MVWSREPALAFRIVPVGPYVCANIHHVTNHPFADLTRTLHRFVDAGEAAAPDTFAPGSRAASECVEEPLADKWGPRPNRDAWIFVHNTAGSGWDHLRALAVLIEADRIVRPLSTVARGAIEAFALAYYVGDPGVDARERVRRYANVRLQSLHDQGFMLETIDAGNDASDEDRDYFKEAMKLHKDQYARVVSSAKRQGFKVYDEKDVLRPTRLGPKVPNKTALSEAVVITTGNSKLGRWYYQQLSAVAHSAMHGLTQHFLTREPLAEPATGDVEVMVGITPEQVATRHVGGALAAMTVMSEVYAYCGWSKPQDVIDELGFTWMGVGRVPIPEGVEVPPAFKRDGWG